MASPSSSAGVSQPMLRRNPGSIVNSLFGREIGQRISNQAALAQTMTHQLIQSRASATLSSTGKRKAVSPVICKFWKDRQENEDGVGGDTDRDGAQGTSNSAWNSHAHPPSARWFMVNVKSAHFIPSFIDNFLVLKTTDCNLRLFYEMCPYLRASPLQVKYSVRDPTTEDWTKLCVWSVNPFCPLMMENGNGSLQKVSNKLMLLRGSKVICYDLSTGNFVDYVDLTFADGPYTYNDILQDDETGRVIVKASACGVRRATHDCSIPMIQELVILSFPPLVALYRLQFPLEFWPRLHYFDVQDNIGIAKSLTQIEIFDLRRLMYLNMSQEERECCCADVFSTRPCSMRTIIISQKFGLLTTFPSKDTYIQFMTASQPPCVVLKNTRSEYELFSLDNLELPVKIIKTTNKPYLLVNEQYELLESGRGDIMRFHLESEGRDSKHFVIQDFSPTTLEPLRTLCSDSIMKVLNSAFCVNNDENETELPTRQGLRKIDYFEDDCVACTAVNRKASLLAVCTLTDETLDAKIYNNDTLELIAKLDPVTISLNNLICHQLVASLTDSCLSLLMYLHRDDSAQAQTVLCLITTLLGEDIPD